MEWKFYCVRVGIAAKTRKEVEGKAAMRYDDFRRSGDIEDRRDDGGGLGGGGVGIGLPMGGGGLGIGTIIVLGLVSYAFGIDPRILIGGAEILTGGGSARPIRPIETAPARPARRRTRWAA